MVFRELFGDLESCRSGSGGSRRCRCCRQSTALSDGFGDVAGHRGVDLDGPRRRRNRRGRSAPRVADEHDLQPRRIGFVDHRETSAWVHDEAAATDKTARLINAKQAGLREEAPSRTVSKDAGNRVAVVGDPGAARSLTDDADVLFIADGRDLADVDGLGDVTMERGRVVDIEGSYGEYELTLEARVTDDCIDCMDCVREGPDGMVTEFPVDIHPDAPDGEWTNTCPTDAIDLDGVTRTVEVDQVIYPGGRDDARGGRLGFYTGPVDAGTIAAVESQLGGIEKPQFLDLEMDVCAAEASSRRDVRPASTPPSRRGRPTDYRLRGVDEVACENCGACTSSCPTGATQLREPSNRRLAREVEALLEDDTDEGLLSRGDSAGIDTQVIAFVCSEYAMDRLRAHGRKAVQSGDLDYPPILPVSVNCTDTVGRHTSCTRFGRSDGVAVVGSGGSCRTPARIPARASRPAQRRQPTLGSVTGSASLRPRPATPRRSSGRCPGSSSSGSTRHRFRPAATRRPAAATPTGRTLAQTPIRRHGWTLESVRHSRPRRARTRGDSRRRTSGSWMQRRVYADADLYEPLSDRRHPADR